MPAIIALAMLPKPMKPYLIKSDLFSFFFYFIIAKHD